MMITDFIFDECKSIWCKKKPKKDRLQHNHTIVESLVHDYFKSPTTNINNQA